MYYTNTSSPFSPGKDTDTEEEYWNTSRAKTCGNKNRNMDTGLKYKWEKSYCCNR